MSGKEPTLWGAADKHAVGQAHTLKAFHPWNFPGVAQPWQPHKSALSIHNLVQPDHSS